MKKTILLSIAALLFGMTAQVVAQDRTLTFIPAAGYQASTPLDQVGDTGYYTRLDGFRAGLDMDYKLIDKVSMDLSLRPGLYYSRKGLVFDRVTPPGGNEFPHIPITLDYLELPVQVVLALNRSPSFSAFINAGPYFGYGLSGRIKYGDRSETVFDNGYKRFDAGFQGGFGIECFRFILSFGVQAGLTNLGEDAAFLLTKKTTNQTLFATLGYRF